MKTAEELIYETGSHFLNCKQLVIDLMIEFAKLHVQEALNQASEKAVNDFVEVERNSILNAYNLDNIK